MSIEFTLTVADAFEDVEHLACADAAGRAFAAGFVRKQKSMRNLATSTMHGSSFHHNHAPDPMIEPSF